MNDSPAANPDPSTPKPGRDSGQSSFHALVGGRVQGVGFRYFVLREARKLDLTGMARNMADGRVEVFAQGPRASLGQLERLLRQGPTFSRVDRVEVEWDVPIPQTSEFSIGF